MSNQDETIKDRERRFLRGLKYILGNSQNFDRDSLIENVNEVGIKRFRDDLSRIYGLEITQQEVSEMHSTRMTVIEFTKIYCPIIYQDRGEIDLGRLIQSSLIKTNDGVALSLREMDNSLKYGMNGGEWCDVSEGPCSCGASH